MKILVIQDRLRSGGTERQSVFLTRAFGAAGHESRLLTFRPGGALADVATDLEPRALQPFDLGLDWFAPGLAGAARRFGPDIVLCMGRMANCHAGGLQRRLPDSAVVCTLRTGKPLPALFRRSLGRVRHVLANGYEARDRAVREHGVARERVSAVYNPLVFSEPAAPGTRAELRRRHGAGENTLVLLCVAMFRPEKNQRELIEAAAGLPAGLDWQLWLAGEGPARGACEALARRLGAAARVRFVGYEPRPAGLYAAADAAVHASRSESLSNFLIEAQAAGLPGAAFQALGVRECFVPGRTGWVLERGDHAGFRAALARLAAEPAPARRARAAEARTFARAVFDPKRQVAAHLELFKLLREP